MANDSIDIKTLQELLLQQETPIDAYNELQRFSYRTAGIAATVENDATLIGKETLKHKKVGAIVMAGGSGTRLGWRGPKGTYPITPINKKSLFQTIVEKTRWASDAAETSLPLAIMTSRENHEQTINYFQTNNFFGLSKDSIDFFPQSSLPLLTAEGNLLQDKNNTTITGPDGNGRVLCHFFQSDIYKKWKEMGIEYVTVMVVDNVLTDPFDRELIGFHIREKNDITVKGILRENPHERLGILIEKDGKIAVIEYSEMEACEKEAKDSEGAIKHKVGNISYFCFSMSFIENKANEMANLPLHKAYKNIPDETLETYELQQQKIWKFEYFIFDLLQLTTKSSVLVYPRSECFAPLKNKMGDESKETVRQLLSEYNKLLLEALTLRKLDFTPLELSFRYSYPTAELQKKLPTMDILPCEYLD